MAYITNIKKTIEGTSININDNAIAKPISIELDGDTTQSGTPTPSSSQPINVVTGLQSVNVCGKNLFNAQIQAGTYNQAVYTVANDGKITQSATDNSAWNTGQARNFYLSAGTYTISIIGKDSSSRLQVRNLTDSSNIIQTRDNSSTFTLDNTKMVALKTWGGSSYPLSYYIQIEKNNQQTTYEPYQDKTFEINLGKNLFDGIFRQGSRFDNELSNAYRLFNTNNFYVEKGTQPTSHIPYKTPTELCEIETYKDYIRKSTGKNLFDKDNANVLNAGFNTGNVNTLSANANAVTIYIPCKKNTTYTFSKSLGARFFVGYTKTTPATGVEVFERAGANDSTKWTITTGNEAQYLVALVYNSSVDTSLTQAQVLSTIQIEEGNIQTPVYEPYGKVWYIKKAIGKVVLDGSESWNEASSVATGTKRFYYDNSNVAFGGDNAILILSNKFKGTTWTNIYVNDTTTKNLIAPASSVGRIVVRIDTNYANSVANFKTWLGTNKPDVYYVLATPQYEVITDDELSEQLEAIRLYIGTNNINISSKNLSGSLKLQYYSQENPYETTIYSQEDENRCKIYFNDVELQDADNYLEKITFKKRILPENGQKIFTLDNFIAEEVEIIIHDIDTSIIQDKVRIELGTLVNNTYEYVPMGIYNIQDTPTRNDDKITIKLRDNAVLFDFNYNGYPLIEQQGGSATKMQILQDICSQANVNCNVENFLGDSDLIGVYDSTIKGRMYVAYLAEQAGCIAKIDRYGNLIFVPLRTIYSHRIPLSIVSKYVNGTPYKIERLVYELGTIKFETSNDETLQTLYISSSNPYISTQSQIEHIFDEIQNFEVNSTEILKDIIGNPCIDGYDLIEVYDDESASEPVLFKTFANNTFTYNGKFRSKYKTEIGLEERKENVTNTGDVVFKKTIQSEIDNVNGRITTEIAETKTYTDDKTNTLRTDLQGQIGNVDTDLQTYKQTVSTTFQQTTESFDFRFTNITDLVGQVSNTENEHYEELIKYIRFINGTIILGEEENELTAELSNNRLSFKQNGNEVAYISNQKLYITDTEVLQNIIIGNFAFIPRSNGSLSFRKVR